MFLHHKAHTLKKGEFLNNIQSEEYKWKGRNHFNGKYMEVIKYLNVPSVFDGEVTPIEIGSIKTGFVNKWGFGFNGYSYVGKKIEEFIALLDEVRAIFHLDNEHRLIVYVHNLQYDFAFFRKLLQIDDIFVYDDRKALYVVSRGIEFRCSYILSNESLERVGEHLIKYKAAKKVGDLDYKLIRTPNTPYTSKEYGYLFGDIDTTMCYIKEVMEQVGDDITRIPLTYTGWVRRDIKDTILNDDKSRRLVYSLKLTTDEYKLWRRSFTGGFCHSNLTHTGIHRKQDEENEGITSYDFSSSYLAVMCSELFPMGNGVKVIWTGNEDEDKKKFRDLMEDFILVFDIQFEELKIKDGIADEPLSKSKCWEIYRHDDDKRPNIYHNGRVVYAKRVCTTMTSEDFKLMDIFYDFENFTVGNCYMYRTGYLPKPLIEKILQYYKLKTELKRVKGRELDYIQNKIKICSVYGLCIQNIVNPIYEYKNNEWKESREPNDEEIDDIIEHYNNSKSRFLWYPWGVMVSAYAKKNLFTGIYEVGDRDYIYSDTDSIKFLRASKHKQYINDYNKLITEKLHMMCDFYKIDKKLLSPKTNEGVSKPLGCWDFDGHYTDFKVLRAKTYIGYRDDDPKDIGLHCTVAGVPKEAIKEYLEKEAKKKGCSVYDIFDKGLKIPKGEADKKGRFYNDKDFDIDVTDYLGNTERVKIYGGVYLDDIDFSIVDVEDDKTISNIMRLLGRKKEGN